MTRHTRSNPWIVLTLLALLTALPVGAQVKSYKKIKYPELPEFKIPKPEVYTLDNGMTVFLMEDHELPLISVNARIRGGSNHVPKERTGMGAIFGQAQREGGTTSITGDELDDFLEARAASIETGMGGDSASASMNCLVEDFDEVFAKFHDVLRHPAFAEDKIELAKVQVNTGIARRNDDVQGIFVREGMRLIRGYDSPLSWMAEYATVAAVTRDDLIALHEKYYHPNNMFLGVVGDFESATMKQKIQETFGGWEKGPDFDEPPVPYQTTIEAGVFFIEKADVTQAYVGMGHLGIETKNPDYFAVQVMNEVLSGGWASRLVANIRTDKGLAYSVGGGVGSGFLRPGIFRVRLSTKASTMSVAVEELKKEVQGLIDRPPTAGELAYAKESILNSFIFNYASRGQILGQQMTYAWFDMPADFLETYRANIEKVTAADVSRVAEKYVHPDQMILLVVGKAEDFDKPVDTFGEVTTVDISIPPPPDTRPEAVVNEATLAAGAEQMARAARTMVGDAKVTAASGSMTIALSIGGQQLSITQEVSIVAPDKLRQVVNTPMGQQTMVINGDRGYAAAGGQSQPLPGDAVQDQLNDLNRDLLVLASEAHGGQVEAVSVGTEEVGGVACDVVEVTYKGSASRLFIDAEGNVLKQSYQGKHPLQGTPGLIELTYSDYRPVSGVLVSHSQVMLFDGQELASIQIDSFEVNPELDPSLFEVPEGG
jgi:predicted Zn-dependent peptidase/outer membrane lipoprotein-sorting protein